MASLLVRFWLPFSWALSLKAVSSINSEAVQEGCGNELVPIAVVQLLLTLEDKDQGPCVSSIPTIMWRRMNHWGKQTNGELSQDGIFKLGQKEIRCPDSIKI